MVFALVEAPCTRACALVNVPCTRAAALGHTGHFAAQVYRIWDVWTVV